MHTDTHEVERILWCLDQSMQLQMRLCVPACAFLWVCLVFDFLFYSTCCMCEHVGEKIHSSDESWCDSGALLFAVNCTILCMVCSTG